MTTQIPAQSQWPIIASNTAFRIRNPIATIVTPRVNADVVTGPVGAAQATR